MNHFSLEMLFKTNILFVYIQIGEGFKQQQKVQKKWTNVSIYKKSLYLSNTEFLFWKTNNKKYNKEKYNLT